MAQSIWDVMDSGWNELVAVRYFLEQLRTCERPVRAQDAHCLLVKAPEVKNFLKSKWNLSQLSHFFSIYPHYFDVKPCGLVQLRDTSLSDEEMECVSSFFELLRNRHNRPLHVQNASCFIDSTSVESFLRANYHLQDMSTFFQKHCDVFHIENGFVSLQCCCSFGDIHGQEQPPLSVPHHQPSTKLSKREKKMEKRAMEFYVNLVTKRDMINTTQAHSFLQNDVELRDYLRSTYQLNDLSAFFKQYPHTFCVRGKEVLLIPAAKEKSLQASALAAKVPLDMKTNELQKKFNRQKAVLDMSTSGTPPQQTEHQTTRLEYGENTWSQKNPEGKRQYDRPLLVKMQSLPASLQKPVGLPDWDIIKEAPSQFTSIMQPVDSQPLDSVVKGSRAHRSSSVSSTGSKVSSVSSSVTKTTCTRLQSSPVPADPTSASSHTNNSLPSILSLLMKHSSTISGTSSASCASLCSDECARFQDVGCQTISSGPILSLCVVHESEKES